MITTTTPATLELTGASGKKYTFYVYPWGTEFKAVGGVYVVLRETRNQTGGLTYHALYIGQTSDLSERFDNHHKAECFRQRRATHIAAMVQNDEKARLAIEVDLIAAYRPPCNE